MAKKIKNNKQLKRNTSDVVHVNSRTYGKHMRAARGSKTSADVNDVFAAHAEKTSAYNAAAKAVHDVLKLYCEGFREGQLWQAILSRMRKAKRMNFGDLLDTLKGTEINNRCTLKRFGNLPTFVVENNKKVLRIGMKPDMRPHLNKNDNCY